MGALSLFPSGFTDTKPKARQLIKLHERRKAARTNWDSLWFDLAKYILPDKDDIYTLHQHRSTGDQKHLRIYDASAVHYNEMLANTLHSMLTNPSQVWMELHHQDKRIDELPRVRKWLQELVEKMIQLLNNTNFQTQIHEIYMDLGAFGTGAMGIFEDEEFIMRFESKPIYHFYIEEDSRGIVNSISNVDEMSVEAAFDKFGEEMFGDEAKKLLEKPEQKIKILQTIMPRASAERHGFGATSFPIASFHVYMAKDIIVRESGFQEFPYVVPRWMKLSDEMYGRGPGSKALPEIKMLNAMRKTTIRGAQKKVDPSIFVPDDGLLGRLNTTPGSVNTYRAGSTDKVFTLETKGDIGIGLELMVDSRVQIKQHFYVDQFQLNIGPQMTATEVNARVEQQLRLLGPVLGRLHFELLQPMVGRMLKIMERRGLLPADPPPELLGDSDLEVFFTSQIAKAQRSGEADALTSFVAGLAPIVEFDSSIVDVVNTDRYVRELARLRGVTQTILNDEDEVADIREAKEAAAAQQAQTQQEMDGAQILKDGAGPAKELGLVS